MRLSISSVLTTVLLTSVILSGICPLLKNQRFLAFTGTGWIKVLFGCILLRLCLSLEFFYTETIIFTRVFTTVREILTAKTEIAKAELECYQLLLLIWLAGSLVCLLRKAYLYFRIKRWIRLCPEKPEETIGKVTKRLDKAYPELKKVKFVKVASGESPYLMGVREKAIVLPDYPFEEKDLEYILEHEAIHIRNHDICWKLLIDFLCAVYWWNPLMKILRDRLFYIIELNNDRKLTVGMNREEKERYMECLYKVTRLTAAKQYMGSIHFSKGDLKEVKQRFHWIAARHQEKKWVQKAAGLGAAGIIFLSTCVVFEPSFPPPEGTFRITKDNTYLVNRDGVYDIYYMDHYVYTVQEIEDFPSDIKIYKE